MDSNILVQIAVVLPVALALAALTAWVVRRIFGARLSVSFSILVLASQVGLSLGFLVAGFVPGLRVWSPTTIALCLGFSILLSFLVAGVVAARRRERERVNLGALLAAGESDRVEFKETARWNVREDKKDPRMELAIAKTVAAFLNSDGGTLVIGANDAGIALGLDRDFATMRVPDADRFELWMRDLFSTLMGRNAAAVPRIEFLEADNGALVCCVVCPRSPRPVYLSQSKDGSSTDLWVRVGNSTRSFAVDEAVEYVGRHWRGRRRRGLAAASG